MKKVLILFVALFLVSGCTSIKNNSFEVLLDEVAKSDLKIYNTYRKGYKYYRPANMYVSDSREYNEFLKNQHDTFYMYIDLISYLSETPLEYQGEGENFYYRNLVQGDKSGYIVIKITQDKKYLVEIAYNYAKIEVIVDESRLNATVSEAMTVLASIEYNDSFLRSLSEESLLSYREEIVDIFKRGEVADSSTLLQYVEEYEEEDQNEVPDLDHIR